MTFSRRRFLQTAAAVPCLWTGSVARSQDKNSRLRLAMIGCGGKGRDDARLAAEYGDFVSVATSTTASCSSVMMSMRLAVYEVPLLQLHA